MQQKVLSRQQFHLIGQLRRLLDMAARGPHAALPGLQCDARKKGPRCGLGAAARGNLTGLGGTVNLNEGRLQAGLNIQRQLWGHRRCGRQDEIRPGNVQTRRQQCLQVDRCRDQHAGLRHDGQCRANVGRVKRVRGAQCRTTLQGEQHAGLKAIHMLRRDRCHNAVAAPVQQTEPVGLGAHALNQCAPAFSVCHR